MQQRLIDANGLIKKAYRSEMWNRSTQAFDLFVVDAEDVEEAPTIDAVEVVRCKDCVHWVEERTDLSIRTGICKMTSEIVSCVFYCAYGVKMDAEVTDDQT